MAEFIMPSMAKQESVKDISEHKAGFVSFGSFTGTTLTDFLKAVCASYYSNSEADKAVNFVATWSGNDYYTGLIRKHGNNVFCMTFIGTNIVSCSYNASNQSITVNDINERITTKSYTANEINISGVIRSFAINNVAYLQIYDMTRSSVSDGMTLGTLPSALTPNTYSGRGIITQMATGKTASVNISANGTITCSGMEANKYYYGTIIYPLNK